MRLHDGFHEVRLARSGETAIPTAAKIEDGGRILTGEDAVARLRRSGADKHRYFAGLGWKPRLATPPPQ